MRVLSLGGGGPRGAFQVPIIEALLAEHEYDLIMGISAGATNGVYAAQRDVDLLWRDWERSVTNHAHRGSPGIYTLSHRPWESVYTLEPLRQRIQGAISLDRLEVPYACGVVVGETGEYRLLATGDMASDDELHAAIVGSSSIAGLTPPASLPGDNGPLTMHDGGHRHSVPPVPAELLPEVTHLDVIFCSPVRSRERASVHHGFAHAVAWSFETARQLAREMDVMHLQLLHRETDIDVRVFAPERELGGLFECAGDHVRMRFEAGRRALEQPVPL